MRTLDVLREHCCLRELFIREHWCSLVIFTSFLKLHLLCVWVRCRLEGNMQNWLSNSFNHAGPGALTWVVRFQGRRLYLLTQLDGPEAVKW